MVTRKMRMLAASLALVLCVSLYSVPRAKAVATEVAVGTAAVASYFQATGLTMAASAGSTGALITTGVADIAGSYAMATGAASSGSAFLSSVAAGVSISPAGAIVLTAAAVVAIGALVAWYIGENSLTEAGSSSVVVAGETVCSYNGYPFPPLPNYDSSVYPYACIVQSAKKGGYVYLGLSEVRPVDYGAYYPYTALVRMKLGTAVPFKYGSYVLENGVWGDPNFGNYSEIDYVYKSATSDSESVILWSNVDILSRNSSAVYLAGSSPVGETSDELVISREPMFMQPDLELDPESQKQMIIDAGFSAGATLDTVATEIPELIAAGTLIPTYEITTTETGGNTGTDTEPEDALAVVPWLERIHTTLTGLGTSVADKVMDGLQSLFVPDEAFFAEAVPELQETFQDRMGLLTFPISLLADFLGRLLDLSDQEPILRWNSVSIYGTELIAAGQYNFKDALKSAQVKQLHDIYMIAVNAILIFAFLNLCHDKYRKIMQN